MHDWAYEVMKKIHSPVAYRPHHGHFISLTKHTDAIAAAYLWLEDGPTDGGTARLDLHPADDIEQAKVFYQNVDLTKLNGLRKGWRMHANLHFGGPFGRGWPPRVNDPPGGFTGYIEYWEGHLNEIKQFEHLNS